MFIIVFFLKKYNTITNSDTECADVHHNNNKECYGLAKPLDGYCCGLCADYQPCPSGYLCHVHPSDQFAVCCPEFVFG